MTQTTSLITTPQSASQPPTETRPSDPLTDLLALLRLAQIIQEVLRTISTLPPPTPKPGTSPKPLYATIASTSKSPSGPKSTPQKSSCSPPSCRPPPVTTNLTSPTSTPTFMGRFKRSKKNSKPSCTPPSPTPLHAPTPTKKTKTSPSSRSPQQGRAQSAKEENHQYVSKMKASKDITRVIEGNTQSPSSTSRRKNWKCSPGYERMKKVPTKP